MELENKMTFSFKKTMKDIILTNEDEEDFKIINCGFFERIDEFDKFRDPRLLTGNYRGPAQSKCNINVTQKQSNFVPFIFHLLILIVIDFCRR